VKKLKDVNNLELYWKFFKIGAFTFGGGFAMIPLIEREVVKNKWITNEDIADIVAISQSIPGAVAVNMSLFVGYRIKQKLGAIIAVLGCITPSVLIILFIATIFKQFQDLEIVQNAFSGILAAIVALIAVSAYKLAKLAIMDWITLIMTVLTVAGLLFLPMINPVLFIVSGALTGFLLYYLYPKKVRELQSKGGKRR
jgi:chromate transporter